MEQQKRTSEAPPDRSKFPSMSNTLNRVDLNHPELKLHTELCDCREFVDKHNPDDPALAVQTQQAFIIVPMKRCRNPVCKFGCEPQPISNFHKSKKSRDGYTSLCKDCKVIYDAKYKAGKLANIDKATLRATAPNKDLYLVKASNKINDCKNMYVLSELELNLNILKGNIKNRDVVIQVKTVSRKQVRFEMVDI